MIDRKGLRDRQPHYDRQGADGAALGGWSRGVRDVERAICVLDKYFSSSSTAFRFIIILCAFVSLKKGESGKRKGSTTCYNNSDHPTVSVHPLVHRFLLESTCVPKQPLCACCERMEGSRRRKGRNRGAQSQDKGKNNDGADSGGTDNAVSAEGEVERAPAQTPEEREKQIQRMKEVYEKRKKQREIRTQNLEPVARPSAGVLKKLDAGQFQKLVCFDLDRYILFIHHSIQASRKILRLFARSRQALLKIISKPSASNVLRVSLLFLCISRSCLLGITNASVCVIQWYFVA